MSAMIHNQVRLPISVAVEVVTQGIRIRFGRSVITILGVAFGIAFLMATMTSQLVRRGVAEQDALSSAVLRMSNFLRAETGVPRDRVYGVVVCGPLDGAEEGLVEELVRNRVRRLLWADKAEAPLPSAVDKTVIQRTTLNDVGREAEAVLVLGKGVVPAAPWDDIMAATHKSVMAFSRRNAEPPALARAAVVMLERELKPGEIERVQEQAKRDRFRTRWIVIISLLVTIIGIGNAMLMSVTERFREIGTMKCLGALSGFICKVFLIESSFMGVVGGLLGAVAGALFSVVMYSFAYGLPTVIATLQPAALFLYLVESVGGGVILSVLAAIYPAIVAAGMMPSDALRANV